MPFALATFAFFSDCSHAQIAWSEFAEEQAHLKFSENTDFDRLIIEKLTENLRLFSWTATVSPFHVKDFSTQGQECVVKEKENEVLRFFIGDNFGVNSVGHVERVRNDLSAFKTSRPKEASRFLLSLLKLLKPNWEIFSNAEPERNILRSIEYFLREGTMLSLGLGRLFYSQQHYLEFDAILPHFPVENIVSIPILSTSAKGHSALPEMRGLIVQFTPELIQAIPAHFNYTTLNEAIYLSPYPNSTGYGFYLNTPLREGTTFDIHAVFSAEAIFDPEERRHHSSGAWQAAEYLSAVFSSSPKTEVVIVEEEAKIRTGEQVEIFHQRLLTRRQNAACRMSLLGLK